MGPSHGLQAVTIAFCCAAFVLGDLPVDNQRLELGKGRKLLQVDFASLASGLMSGLQQGRQQPSDSQLMSGVNEILNSRDPVSEAANALTNAGQQTFYEAASMLDSTASGVLSAGLQGESQMVQLLTNALQVIEQVPGVSELDARETERLRYALNGDLPQLLASLLVGDRQGQEMVSQPLQLALQLPPVGVPLPSLQSALQLPAAGTPLPSLFQALQETFQQPAEEAPPPSFTDALQDALQLPDVGAPLPDLTAMLQDTLQLPTAGAPLPSFAEVLQRALQLPAAGALPSAIPQLPNAAFPLLPRSPPGTQSNEAEPSHQVTDIPPGQPTSGLLPDSAEAGIAAPSLPGQFADLIFTSLPGPAPAPKMEPAPAPAPMFAPAPAPAQILNITFEYNITTATQQAMSFAASFAETFGLSTMGGVEVSAAINETQDFLQELTVLASPLANSDDYLQALRSGKGVFDKSCAKDKVELPKKVPPSCMGKSMELSLVPWNCMLDDESNVLSCSPAYLTLTKNPDSCTLLDFKEGTIAGKECGLVKRFGLPKKEIFGGQKFVLKVLDALISLEKAAGGSVDGPLATIAIAAAPFEDVPSSITEAVTTFLGG